MIHLGCGAYNFVSWSLDDALRLLGNLGFEYADVGANAATSQVSQAEAAEQPEAVGRRIAATAARYGIKPAELWLCLVHVEGKPVDTNHPDASTRSRLLEAFRSLCACAAAGGFRSVMGVPGKVHAEIGFDESWRLAVDSLARMIAIAREEGVQLNVEPHRDSIIEKPDLALRMAHEVPGLTYALDYTHFVGHRCPAEEIAPLHEFAGHMHAKQAYPGCFKCRFHEGSIDYGLIVEDLVRRGWDGVFSMEYIGPMNTEFIVDNAAFQSMLLAQDIGRAVRRHIA